MEVVSIAVAGASGRMGRAVIAEAAKSPGVKIAGLYERAGHDSVGQRVCGIAISNGIEKASGAADVIVDFTSPEATLAHALYCRDAGKAMVIGTTGFTTEQKDELVKMTEFFPCVLSPNMSVGVNLLEQIVCFASRKLGDDFDIEIAEAHHREKTDSPSGTALALARAAAESRNSVSDSVTLCGRKNADGKRGKNEIGIQSVRGGDTPGEHLVLFLGNGERLEFSHKASDRSIFAVGAVRAARWICAKPAGLYGMKEALNL